MFICFKISSQAFASKEMEAIELFCKESLIFAWKISEMRWWPVYPLDLENHCCTKLQSQLVYFYWANNRRLTTHCINGGSIEKTFYVHGSEGYTLRYWFILMSPERTKDFKLIEAMANPGTNSIKYRESISHEYKCRYWKVIQQTILSSKSSTSPWSDKIYSVLL